MTAIGDSPTADAAPSVPVSLYELATAPGTTTRRAERASRVPTAAYLSSLYRDEVDALAIATCRPTSVVRRGTGFLLCVEFEFDRFLLATNSPLGTLDPSPRRTEPPRWVVQFFARDDGNERFLVEAANEWLIDAFDDALIRVCRQGHWVRADLKYGHLTAPREAATA